MVHRCRVRTVACSAMTLLWGSHWVIGHHIRHCNMWYLKHLCLSACCSKLVWRYILIESTDEILNARNNSKHKTNTYNNLYKVYRIKCIDTPVQTYSSIITHINIPHWESNRLVGVPATRGLPIAGPNRTEAAFLLFSSVRLEWTWDGSGGGSESCRDKENNVIAFIFASIN